MLARYIIKSHLTWPELTNFDSTDFLQAKFIRSLPSLLLSHRSRISTIPFALISRNSSRPSVNVLGPWFPLTPRVPLQKAGATFGHPQRGIFQHLSHTRTIDVPCDRHADRLALRKGLISPQSPFAQILFFRLPRPQKLSLSSWPQPGA